MKTARAKITWLLDKKRIPPVLDEKDRKTCNSYAPIIVFKGQYDRPIWAGRTTTAPVWSSVILNESINDKASISTITYLVDEAPFELLKIGAEFELFEGSNKVAFGTIIEKID